MSKLPENALSGLPGDGEIASRARAIFRDACEGADSYHAQRLGLARRRAMDARAKRPARWVWAPVMGAAACCALVVGLVWMRPPSHLARTGHLTPSTAVAAGQDPDDLATEISNNQMDMVQNLDFYRWLAAQPTMVSARSRRIR